MELGITFNIREEYYSVSAQNVLRGLHFQIPPKATAKLVLCLHGRVFDAVVDLRKGSNTFLKSYTLELSSENHRLIYIPEGLAHGFYVLSKEAVLLYMSTQVYASECYSGIHWTSAGIKWLSLKSTISEQDDALLPLIEFDNPFQL